MPDLSSIVVIGALAFVMAGFVKGVLGQGLPTVAVGVLSLVMSPGEATALLIIPAFITNIWQALQGDSLRPLIRRLWPTLIASALGTWAATFAGLNLLTPEAAALARKTLGVVLILYGMLGISRVQLTVPPWAERWLGPVMGGANGVVATATGVFMVPVIPYIQALGLGRDDLVQAQGISFSVSTLALAVVLTGTGTLNSSTVLGSVAALAVTFAGMFLGQSVRKRVQPDLFRLMFFSMMLVLGVHFTFFHR